MTTLLVWIAVGIALWQLWRRTAREREAAVQRERLRIARDVHDSLGRRLGLASLQAGALEVAARDAETAAAAQRLGGTVRDAAEDLHDLVGVLRGGAAPAGTDLAYDAVAALVNESRAAGCEVDLVWRGTPIDLRPGAGRAALALIEEGLANAAKHAPGAPVAVALTWEDDALLASVSNPLGSASGRTGGNGLTGMRERVEAAGGLLDLRSEDGRFEASAMLPAAAGPRRRATTLAWAATLILLLALLPVSVAGPA